LVCDESHASVEFLNPLLGGHAYVALEPSDGMPGLASWQLKPSRLPLPVQLVPHETSFSRATLTHLVLLQSLSFAQKHPPAALQSPDALLHFPNGQDENPVAVEVGQPPSGHGAPPSVTVLPVHVEPAHVCPTPQAMPHAPQLLGSEVVFVHLLPHAVGALAGQVATHPNDPASSGEQRPASPVQGLSQLPQLEAEVGSVHPPSHVSSAAAHPPPSAMPPSSPGGGMASSPTMPPSSVSTCSSPGFGWTLASHP
jgi:hypothetical protein